MCICIQMDRLLPCLCTCTHFSYCLYSVWSQQIDQHSQLIHLIRKRERERQSINHRLEDMSLVLKFSWVSVIDLQFKRSPAVYPCKKKIHMKCPTVTHLKVCVWVLLCLFVRSRVMATICTFHQKSVECVEPSLSLWRTDPYQIIIDGDAIWTMNQSWSRSHSGAETYHIWQGPHWMTAGHQHAHTHTNKQAPTHMDRLLHFSLKVKSISRCHGCSYTPYSPVVVVLMRNLTQLDESFCLHKVFQCHDLTTTVLWVSHTSSNVATHTERAAYLAEL